MNIENGNKIWRNRIGQFHRTNGDPAIERADGSKEWWVNGKQHRTDGPAVVFSNGDKEWWVNNQRHRTDGPAVWDENGDKEWWIHNRKVSKSDVL
jgi:hypothetical protein